MTTRSRLALSFLALVALPRAVNARGSCGKGGPTGANIMVPFAPSEYYVFAPADQSKPLPLMIVLHGDEGRPGGIISTFTPVWNASKDFFLVGPRAPYKNGSWYQDWEGHTKWLDGMLADVAAKYNVDIDRIYMMGVSGGSYMMSFYALKRPNVIAAGQWNCGGKALSTDPPRPTGECKVAGRFVVTDGDFDRNDMMGAYEKMKMNGYDVELVNGGTGKHCSATAEYGGKAWAWLKEKTLCKAGPMDGCFNVGDPPTAAPRPAGGSPAQKDGGGADAQGGAGGSADGGRAGGSDGGVGGGAGGVGGGAGGAGGGAGGAGGGSTPTEADGGVTRRGVRGIEGGCTLVGRGQGSRPYWIAIAGLLALMARRRRAA